jgi:hypothetical protein
MLRPLDRRQKGFRRRCFLAYVGVISGLRCAPSRSTPII